MFAKSNHMVEALIGPLIASTLTLTPPVSAQSYQCLPESSDESAGMLTHITALVTAPAQDSLLTATRQAYQLPVASASDVSIETKKPTCKSAGAAYHAFAHPSDPPTDRTLVVVNVARSHFVVLDVDEVYGEYRLQVVFDADWNPLASLTN